MNAVKELIKLLKEPDNKPTPYDADATVTRVDGDTVWVHIAGGVDETPIEKTIDAKKGDNVRIRVSGGRAWLTGNASAPPTDDAVANEAKGIAEKASGIVTVVKGIAENAMRIAGNTNQYFWHKETGDDTGAHITEMPREAFEADPENGGGNLLARSNGIAVRDGLEELSVFGADGMRIGKANEQHIQITPSSFEVYDGEGGVPFSVNTEGERKTEGYGWLAYTEGNSGMQFQLVLKGEVVNGRYYIMVGTSEPPDSTTYYIDNPTTDEWKSITIDGVNVSLKKTRDNIIQAISWNHNNTARYTKIRVQMTYMESTAVINQRLMRPTSKTIAIEDSIGTHSYGMAYTYGNMAHVEIACQRGTSVADGEMIYSGKFFELIPVLNAHLEGHVFTSAGFASIIGHLGLTGTINVYNVSGRTLPSPCNVTVTATYIIKDGS